MEGYPLQAVLERCDREESKARRRLAEAMGAYRLCRARHEEAERVVRDHLGQMKEQIRRLDSYRRQLSYSAAGASAFCQNLSRHEKWLERAKRRARDWDERTKQAEKVVGIARDSLAECQRERDKLASHQASWQEEQARIGDAAETEYQDLLAGLPRRDGH